MTIPLRDLYADLGLDRYATQADIDRAYRRIVRTLHPDRNPDPDAREEFDRVTATYEILRDPDKRRKWHEQYFGVDGSTVLDDVESWLSRFISTDKLNIALMVLWSAHTHMAEELYTSPRLRLDSISHGSGKTTTFEHLKYLCYRAISAVGLTSGAVITRSLQSGYRTILFDEIDKTNPDVVREILAVVNSGYKRGATRLVNEKVDGHWEPVELPTFAPVAMAGNHPLLPHDTQSREIKIVLVPDLDGSYEHSDWELIEEDAIELGDRLASWGQSVRDDVRGLDVDLPDGVRGRMMEMWKPLARVAKVAGGRWPELAQQLMIRALEQHAAAKEAGMTPEPPTITLLSDLCQVIPADRVSLIPTRDQDNGERGLVGMLIEYNPDTWGADGIYGKALTEKQLGNLLKDCLITSQRQGGRGPRGYFRHQFESLWQQLHMHPVQPGAIQRTRRIRAKRVGKQ